MTRHRHIAGQQVIPKGPEDAAYARAVTAFQERDREAFQAAISALLVLAKGAQLRRKHEREAA